MRISTTQYLGHGVDSDDSSSGFTPYYTDIDSSKQRDCNASTRLRIASGRVDAVQQKLLPTVAQELSLNHAAYFLWTTLEMHHRTRGKCTREPEPSNTYIKKHHILLKTLDRVSSGQPQSAGHPAIGEQILRT